MTPIERIIDLQKHFFNTGATRSIEFRKDRLRRLRTVIHEMETDIFQALHTDLGKSGTEAYITEVGLVLEEIRFALRHVAKWARPGRVRTPLIHFPGTSRIQPEPLGRVLIIAPWNYPFQLSLSPLVGSMAAGNCAVLKPSELAPETSRILAELIKRTFDAESIAAVEGDARTSAELLAAPFDHVFFTGSERVGRIVMTAAAKHLTPVTLELGGKSPCIVDRDVDPRHAAKRIVFGKFTNAGQTCVAPDYLLLPRGQKGRWVEAITQAIQRLYGKDAETSPDYGRIVNGAHFDRLTGYLSDGRILFGGRTDPKTRFFAPTLIDRVADGSPVMSEEIFGPILPVLTYDRLDEAIDRVTNRPKPLALYFFSNSRKRRERILDTIAFGGGCINDTLIHLATPHLPFGGVGASGMGNYHGKAGFDTFSHGKSIMIRPLLPDMPLRFPPYGNRLKIFKKLFK